MAVAAIMASDSVRYFRCMLAKAEEGLPAGRVGPASEFGLLAARLRALAPAQERRGDAEWLVKAGRRAEADRLWSEDVDEVAFRADAAFLESHPAMRALRAKRLGAYLGCPERDRE
jgi:hypothetical protein